MSQNRQPSAALSPAIHSKQRLNIENFRLYVFQPNAAFYYLPFQKRLDLLEKSIINANQQFKAANLPATAKAVFVAPEYLFKDFSQIASNRYYSHTEKNIYVQKLIELSKQSNLVIVPGTICWKKYSNKTNLPFQFFRNSAYLFHQGQREKYKKTCLAPSDEDFIGSDVIQNTVFVRGTNDTPIKQLNGISIGIEICLDNCFSVLRQHCDQENIPAHALDIHLVLASGLISDTPPCTSSLFIKIDHPPGYTVSANTFPNQIGRFHYTPYSQKKLEFSAATCHTEQDNLFCYEFNGTTTLTLRRGKLPAKFELNLSDYLEQLKKQILACDIRKLRPNIINTLITYLSINARFNHTVEMDFPDHVIALSKAGLLNDNNALMLFLAPQFAYTYTSALIYLNEAGLLFPEVNALLNKNIDKSMTIKNLIFTLYNTNHLTQDDLRLFARTTKIFSLNQKTIAEVYTLFLELINLNVFKIDYLFKIFETQEEFKKLFLAFKFTVFHGDMIRNFLPKNFFDLYPFDDFINYINAHKNQLDDITLLASDLSKLLSRFPKNSSQPLALFGTQHNAITTSSFVTQKNACVTLLRNIFGDRSVVLSDEEKTALTSGTFNNLTKKHAGALIELQIDLSAASCHSKLRRASN